MGTLYGNQAEQVHCVWVLHCQLGNVTVTCGAPDPQEDNASEAAVTELRPKRTQARKYT